MDAPTKTAILHAVDRLFDKEVEFLAELSRQPSTRGNEQSAQSFVAAALEDRGYEVDRWSVRVEDIAHLPGFSPVIGDYSDATNVVGAHRSTRRSGRSLILNGHVDVVPPGPLDMWRRPPFEPYVDDGWIVGRGTGDMKAGLASNLFALDALRAMSLAPSADVFFQSVIEEECTGNGALACLQRGYRAEAALIPEPLAERLVSAQVGVLWFRVIVKGEPTHVSDAKSGSNAIEAAMSLIAALHRMEARWNQTERRPASYRDQPQALTLNVGRIEGGDWASSVPAWCVFDLRMGLFPGQPIDQAKQEIEEVLDEAAQDHAFLRDNRPKITWNGFQAEGYVLADHNTLSADRAIRTLEDAHREVTGLVLDKTAITATTDARFFGLYADTPTLVYGPRAEAVHGFNERVELESVRRVTQTTALFIAQWCGLEAL